MQWYSEGKRRQWTDCTVELQRGVDGKGLEETLFTCHYNLSGKVKVYSQGSVLGLCKKKILIDGDDKSNFREVMMHDWQ